MATENVDVSIGEVGGGSAALTAAIQRMATAADQLSSSTDRSSAAQRAGSQAASQHASSMGVLQNAVGQTRNSFNTLQSALQGYGSYLSVKKLIEYADGFTGIQNKLKLTSKDSDALAKSTAEVFRISQATRADFEGSVNVYTRLQTALKGLNRDTASAGPLLTTINQAIALSGSTGETAKAGLEQFQQSLNKGKLSGEEFNSVMVGLPALAAAIAAGMNKPVSALKALADAQMLTSKVVIDALEKSSGSVAKAFAQSNPTIQQGFTLLNNAFLYYIGNADKGKGATNFFFNALLQLADHMQIVAPIALSLAAALVLNTIAGAVAGVYSMVASLVALTVSMVSTTAAFLISPWGFAFMAGLAAAAAAVYYFRDTLKDLAKDIPVLGPLFGGLVDWLNKKKDATDKATGAGKGFGDYLKEVYAKLNDFTGGAGAATKAVQGHGQATQDATVHLNAYGEKLMSLDTLLKNAKKIEDDRRDAINASFKAMGVATIGANGLLEVTEKLTSATGRNTVAVNDNTSAIQRAGSAHVGYLENLQGGLGAITATQASLEGLQNAYQSTGTQAERAAKLAELAAASYAASAASMGTSLKNINAATTFTDKTGTTTTPNNDPNAGGFSSPGNVSTYLQYDGNSVAYWTLAQTSGFPQIFQDAARLQKMLDGMGKGLDRDQVATLIKSQASSPKPFKYNEAAGYATGGSFMVGGMGGTDSQVVQFRASPDERVTIETPAQVKGRANPVFGGEGGGRRPMQSVVVNMQVKTDDYDNMRRNQRQVGQDFGKRLAKAI